MPYEISFDADKRKDFLTGFRKRKNERRQKAKEELQKKLKEEMTKMRQEKRKEENKEPISYAENFENMMEGIKDKSSKTLDLPQHNVTVIETELWDPSQGLLYMGENDEKKEEIAKEKEQEEGEKKEKKFNTKKTAKTIVNLSRRHQNLVSSNKTKKLSTSKKLGKRSKRFLRKKSTNVHKNKR